MTCIHGWRFPCAQCLASRHWSEAAAGKKMSEDEFSARYGAGDTAACSPAEDVVWCPTHKLRCLSSGEARQQEIDSTKVYVCSLCGQECDEIPF
jgi:hypothetical protein